MVDTCESGQPKFNCFFCFCFLDTIYPALYLLINCSWYPNWNFSKDIYRECMFIWRSEGGVGLFLSPGGSIQKVAVFWSISTDPLVLKGVMIGIPRVLQETESWILAHFISQTRILPCLISICHANVSKWQDKMLSLINFPTYADISYSFCVGTCGQWQTEFLAEKGKSNGVTSAMLVGIGYFRPSFETFGKILLRGIRYLIHYGSQGEGKTVAWVNFLENSNSEVVTEFDFCRMANNPRALSGADSYKSGSSLNLAELIKGSITIYKKIPRSFFKYMKSSSNMKNTHPVSCKIGSQSSVSWEWQVVLTHAGFEAAVQDTAERSFRLLSNPHWLIFSV